jgi:ribosomal protein S18 acetylase RimI-like enzyme
VRINFRRWNMNDIESVRNLLHETWMKTYAGFIPGEDITSYLDEHYHRDAFRTFVDDQHVVGFIADVDGKVGGYEKTFYNREEKRLYVQQLYILPRYQGLGLGKQLMTFAAEHAKTYDLDRLWLGVMVDNTAALLWYQNMGYQIVEKTPFLLGKTTVEHFIGFIPLDAIFRLNETKH